MNKIKMTILGLGILFGSTAFAQEQKSDLTKEQRVEKKVDKLGEELDLTDAQKLQYIELRKSSMNERQKIKGDEALTDESRKEAKKAIRLQNKEKMAKILTEEQVLKLQAMKKEKRAKHKKQCCSKEQHHNKKVGKEHYKKQVVPHKAKKLEE